MFKCVSGFLFILYLNSILAQGSALIDLPPSSEFSSRRIDTITGAIEISIVHENGIYLKGEKINDASKIYPTIANRAFWESLGDNEYNFVLNADMSVKLSVVYDVLDQLRKFSKPFIYLKVGRADSRLYEMCLLHGWNINKIFPRENDSLDSPYKDLVITPLGLPEGYDDPDSTGRYETFENFKTDLYDLNVVEAQEVLSNFNHIKLTILAGDKILIDNTEFGFPKFEEIWRMYANGDIVLVTFDKDLTYAEYTSYLQAMRHYGKNITIDYEVKGLFLEIPYYFEEALRGLNFALLQKKD